MKIVFYISAYVVPAALVWSVLGVVLWLIADLQMIVAFVACGYAMLFGLVEIFKLPLQSPGSSWQVPANWLKGRSSTAQTLIWGVTLGPGLITRNPYAGIWLVPLLLTLNHSLPAVVLGSAIVGVAHAGGRAIGVITNLKHMETSCGHLLVLGAQLRWKFADGLTLLLAAGALVAYTLTLLGVGV